MAADQTNLGRVQGGGIFMSTADSSTSINISTLSPTTIKPMIGDTVLFQNGDIRAVIAVSDSNVTCGTVIANTKGNKGDKGDQGDQGAGIRKIEKISSEGLIDTYVITMTNNTTFTYYVTNGQDGQDGQDGSDGGVPYVASYRDGLIGNIDNLRINSIYLIVGANNDLFNLAVLKTSSNYADDGINPAGFRACITGAESFTQLAHRGSATFSNLPVGRLYYFGENDVFNSFEYIAPTPDPDPDPTPDPTLVTKQCQCCGGIFEVEESCVECPNCNPGNQDLETYIPTPDPGPTPDPVFVTKYCQCCEQYFEVEESDNECPACISGNQNLTTDLPEDIPDYTYEIPVPIGEYVYSISFNADLSVTDTVNIIENANLPWQVHNSNFPNNKTYYIFASNHDYIRITKDEDTHYSIEHGFYTKSSANGRYSWYSNKIFVSDNHYSANSDFIGWDVEEGNTKVSFIVGSESNAETPTTISSTTMSVGTHNTSLFSLVYTYGSGTEPDSQSVYCGCCGTSWTGSTDDACPNCGEDQTFVCDPNVPVCPECKRYDVTLGPDGVCYSCNPNQSTPDSVLVRKWCGCCETYYEVEESDDMCPTCGGPYLEDL